MAIFFFSCSAFLFYSTSKYFPLSIPKEFAGNRRIRNTASVLFVVLSIVLMNQSMDIVTAALVALASLMTLIPLLVLSLSAYPRSWVGWVIAVIVIAIIDLFQYAG